MDDTGSVSALHREHQLTRLLALSFDGAASPSITLRALEPGEWRSNNPYGWGFAWYPDGHGALVIKDPTSIGENAMTKLLRTWERFESTLFLCHLRGAARTLSERDTQPFSRAFGGRDWIFAHNGDLRGPHGRLEAALPIDGQWPLFKPVGRTDSEHAFCWLLARAYREGASRLAEIGWERLHGWLRELDDLGTANFLISDGTDLVAYHDADQYNGLFTTRLVPPHAAKLETDDIVADLDDAGDRNRSVVVFSTSTLDGATWDKLEGGRMIVTRRGAYIWDSHADDATRRLWVPPLSPNDASAKPAARDVPLQENTPQRPGASPRVRRPENP